MYEDVYEATSTAIVRPCFCADGSYMSGKPRPATTSTPEYLTAQTAEYAARRRSLS
ncbi:hypothetical protein PR002_g31276 [Phytophthora rubi]|uniref:Uncharacterized protein n=1 Tax=Phytophthora rubi TaxID=129364 RepID=A0A6A3GJI7_9STRA|nr:hypothetical protein PR002_g31276 [Phytophthora rubi]